MDDRELLKILETDPERGIRQMMQQYAASHGAKLVFSCLFHHCREVRQRSQCRRRRGMCERCVL